MACIDACPKDCISIADRVYHYNAVVNEEKCINCKACSRVCPNIHPVEKHEPNTWYQGWAERSIRMNSASGGIASIIITAFIQNGGYVASCLFENGEFVFDITNSVERAQKFAGSKYVKSNPRGIYKKIKELLKNNRVLFIALPCQVAAMKNSVKNHKNLYTIDLICHGTPSPTILDSYLKEHSIDICRIKNIQFRSKNDAKLPDNSVKLCEEGIDDYTMGFLAAINYTENCYSCAYATTNRVADMTLGDSWGTEYYDEEPNGVSLVMIQTEKGQELLNIAQAQLLPVDVDNAIKNNHQLRHPSVLTNKRQRFLQLILSGKSISYATFIVFKKEIIKRKIKRILLKLKLYRPAVHNIYSLIIQK